MSQTIVGSLRPALYRGSDISSLMNVPLTEERPFNTLAFLMSAAAGTTYVLAIDGNVGDFDSHTARITPIQATPDNDDLVNAVPLLGHPVTWTQSLAESTTQSVEPAHRLPLGDPRKPRRTVWYAWQPSASGVYRVAADGFAFDPLVAVYEQRAGRTKVVGPPVEHTAAADDLASCQFVAHWGNTYQIVVASTAETGEGDFTLDLSLIEPFVITPFVAWQQNHFSDDPSNAAPEADPDRDGSNNLLEYALDSDPVSARPAMLEVSREWRLKHPRRSDETISYAYEASLDLKTWRLLTEGEDYESTISDGSASITLVTAVEETFLRIRADLIVIEALDER